MSGRFVRASKYRHVFGRGTRKEQCYDNVRISRNAWDTNLVKVNPHYLSVNWEASGGGAFAVIPLEEKGKLPEQLPLFRGHTAAVLDTDWNPFNDSLLASGSDDGKVFLWKVPEGFSIHTEEEEPEDIAPIAKLTGHSRKVGHVLFNPAAENILATASGDYTIKLWDAEKGASSLTLNHGEIVQSLSWSADGSQLVTTCRDKKLRIWDPRSQRAAHEVPGHSGAKNSRAVWMGEHDRIATTGFSKMSDRQLGLWDARDPTEPIGGFQVLDSISGVCMPFWDDGTQCLYLAGKGDGNIRYYEYSNDKFEYLSEHKSADPQRGIAFMPKRGVNTHDNEVMRAYKTVNDAYIEPISFIVPRRAEVFQGDIYPPATGTQPGVSAAQWLGGENKLPSKIDLESLYDGSEPVVVPASQKLASSVESQPQPASTTASAPAPKPAQEPKAEPAPSSGNAPTARAAAIGNELGGGSIKQAQNSMSNLASKFADNNDDPEESEDEKRTSPTKEPEQDFDEVPKPHARAAATISSPAASVSTAKSPTISTATSPPADKALDQSQSTKPASASSADPSSPITSSSMLKDIKSLLQEQNRKIEDLTAEVGHLKARLGDKA